MCFDKISKFPVFRDILFFGHFPCAVGTLIITYCYAYLLKGGRLEVGGPERAVVAGRVDPAVVVVGAHDVVNGPTVRCERAHTLLTPGLGEDKYRQ